MTPKTLVMDTEAEKILGSGTVDFAKERYALALNAQSKKPSLMALRGPIVVDGTFKGGNMVFGLKQNGVGLGKISPKVPKSEVAAVDKVRAEIISGKIKNIPTVVK